MGSRCWEMGSRYWVNANRFMRRGDKIMKYDIDLVWYVCIVLISTLIFPLRGRSRSLRLEPGASDSNTVCLMEQARAVHEPY